MSIISSRKIEDKIDGIGSKTSLQGIPINILKLSMKT